MDGSLLVVLGELHWMCIKLILQLGRSLPLQNLNGDRFGRKIPAKLPPFGGDQPAGTGHYNLSRKPSLHTNLFQKKGTPLKTNKEPKNGGLEDDVPFQTGENLRFKDDVLGIRKMDPLKVLLGAFFGGIVPSPP